MMNRIPPAALGWFGAVMVLMLWSGWIVVSRLGVSQSLNAYDIGALRVLAASVVVAPFALRYWPRHLSWWKLLLLTCGTGIPYVLFAVLGMTYAPASHAGVLMNGALPVLASMFAWWWLRETPLPLRAMGMAIILCGTLAIGWDRSSAGVGPDAWIGHLCFLISAALLAAYMTAGRLWGLTPMQAFVSVPLVNIVWFGPLYLFVLPKGIDRAAPFDVWLQALYQGLGPGSLGVLCFMLAVRFIGPTATAAVLAGVPGVAALIAIPTIGEWPSQMAWAGLALVTAGIFLTSGWTPGFGIGRLKVVSDQG